MVTLERTISKNETEPRRDTRSRVNRTDDTDE